MWTIQVKLRLLIFLSKNAKTFPVARNIPNILIVPIKDETDDTWDVRFMGCNRAKMKANGTL